MGMAPIASSLEGKTRKRTVFLFLLLQAFNNTNIIKFKPDNLETKINLQRMLACVELIFFFVT